MKYSSNSGISTRRARNGGKCRLHASRRISGDDQKLLNAAFRKRVNLPLDQRFAANVKKCLGDIGSERQKTLALAGAENHDFHKT